jgi:ABC-type Mn2+/Zn2+ transport system permease subunit
MSRQQMMASAANASAVFFGAALCVVLTYKLRLPPMQSLEALTAALFFIACFHWWRYIKEAT